MSQLFDEPVELVEPVEVVDDRPVLLPVQQQLIERGRQAYKTAQRVIFQAPCGAGKTWVSSEQTRMALEKGKTVLHIVHRRRLVDQMINTLRRFNIKASPIMEGRSAWKSNVYCASRDTLLATIKLGGSLPLADLILVDECHIQSQEVTNYYLKNCPNAYWTGYTATPVCSNGRSLNPPYQALVCMATTSEMIALGRLCPVKVYNPDGVGQSRRKGAKVKPVGDPVDHWKKYANGLPTVAFAANVAESKALVQRYVDAGIAAEHLDALTPEEEREAIFERSKSGETKVVSNCGVLIEGIDLPWLTCCQILRGCNSLVLFIQATGRVMRTYPGKHFGIILDHAAAAHEFGMPDSDFQWTLDDEKTNAKKNKPPKDRKPVTCIKCGAVFVGKAACPECGHVLPRKRHKSLLEGIDHGDGILTEFNERQNGHMTSDMLTRLFKKCYFTARARGGTMKQASTMFSRQAGMPPWKAELQVRIPSFDEWNTPAKDWQLNANNP